METQATEAPNATEETKEAPAEAAKPAEATDSDGGTGQGPSQSAPAVVSEVDRLKAENINLRLLNAINQETLAQQAVNNAQRGLQEATKARLEMTKEVEACRNELAEKYGVDFETHQISEGTGAIVPRPRPNMPPQMQAQMAAMQRQKG